MQIDQAHFQFKLLSDRIASNDRPAFLPQEIDEYLNLAIIQFIKLRYGVDRLNASKLGFEKNQKSIDELASLHIKSPEVQPEIYPITNPYNQQGLYEFRLNDLGNNINGQYFRYLFLTKLELKIQKGNCIKTIDVKNWQIDDAKTQFTASSWKWNRVLANFGKSSTVLTSLPNSNLISPDYSIEIGTNYNTNNLDYRNDDLKSIYIDTRNIYKIPEFNVISANVNYIKYPNRVCLGNYQHIDKHGIGINGLSRRVEFDIEDAFHDEIIRIAVQMAHSSLNDIQGVQLMSQMTNTDMN